MTVFAVAVRRELAEQVLSDPLTIDRMNKAATWGEALRIFAEAAAGVGSHPESSRCKRRVLPSLSRLSEILLNRRDSHTTANSKDTEISL